MVLLGKDFPALTASSSKVKPPPPSTPCPTNRPPVPDVPEQFKDKVAPAKITSAAKTIVAPKRAASTSSARSGSGSSWRDGRRKRQVS